MALRAQIHREGSRKQVGVIFPAAGDLGGQRRRRPGVHDVWLTGEAAKLVPLLRGVSGWHMGLRVDGQRRFVRHDRVLVVGTPFAVEPVPQRDRHAEEPLARDQPVPVEPLHPVLIPVAHVVGVPVELLAPGDQLGPQFR